MARRLKSGRLGKGARKRKLRGADPGSVIIIDKLRAQKVGKGGRRSRTGNVFAVEFGVCAGQNILSSPNVPVEHLNLL